MAFVDKEKLEQDARELLLAGSKPHQWDAGVGALDTPPTSRTRQARVSAVVQVVDDVSHVAMPVGLGVLFDLVVNELEQPRPWLEHFFDLLLMPSPSEDRCLRLHEQAIELQKKKRETEANRIKALLDEEDKECTFSPVVSQAAKAMQGKGKDKFFEEAVMWKKGALKKIEAKRLKDAKEKHEEIMVPWSMNEKSRALVDKQRQQRDGGGDAHQFTPPRRGHHYDEDCTFTPVTNPSPTAREKDIARQLRGGGSTERAEDEARKDVVERLQEDMEGRKDRRVQRMKAYEKERNKKLFDNVTGQPLFIPNAQPMVNYNGTMCRLSDVPARERKEIMKSKHIDFIPKARDPDTRRSHEDIVAHMQQHYSKSQKKLERIRKKEAVTDLKGLFKPQIEEASQKMMDAKKYVPVHKRTLKKKEEAKAEPRKKERTKEELQAVFDRNKEWVERKNRKLSRTAMTTDKEEMQDCTFQPKLTGKTLEVVATMHPRLTAEYQNVVQMQKSQERRSPSGPRYEAAELLPPPELASGGTARHRAPPSTSSTLRQLDATIESPPPRPVGPAVASRYAEDPLRPYYARSLSTRSLSTLSVSTKESFKPLAKGTRSVSHGAQSTVSSIQGSMPEAPPSYQQHSLARSATATSTAASDVLSKEEEEMNQLKEAWSQLRRFSEV